MKPIPAFRRSQRFALATLALVIGCGVVCAAEPKVVNEKPLEMEPVLVSTLYTSIKLRPILRETVVGGRQVIALVRIEEVRKNSPAERAGLFPGYEVLAINGVKVKGLEEAELDKLWRGPFFDDVLVFRVAAIRPGLSPPAYDIKIPLKKDPPVKVSFSFELVQPPPKSESSAGPAPKN